MQNYFSLFYIWISPIILKLREQKLIDFNKINIIVLLIILFIAAIVESLTGLIPDVITIPSILIGCIIGFFTHNFKQRLISLIINFIIIIILGNILYNFDIAIGGGAFKLMLVIAVFTSVLYTIICWVLAASIFLIAILMFQYYPNLYNLFPFLFAIDVNKALKGSYIIDFSFLSQMIIIYWLGLDKYLKSIKLNFIINNKK